MSEHPLLCMSSEGLMRSCDHYFTPPLRENFAGFMEKTLSTMKFGETIYIQSIFLQQFVSQYLPRITQKFRLVSGTSRLIVPEEALDEDSFYTLLASPLLIHWHSEHLTFPHPTVSQIPSGVDFATIQEERVFLQLCESPDFKTYGMRQAGSVVCDVGHHLPLQGDIDVAMVDLSDPEKRWAAFLNHNWVALPYERKGLQPKYVWEALMLGCIPILLSSTVENSYNDMPIIFVKKMEDLNKEKLGKLTKIVLDYNVLYDKFTLKYWNSCVKSIGRNY